MNPPAVQIEASVTRWIAEARALGPRAGYAALHRKARWVNSKLQTQRGPAFDLANARERLMAAALTLRDMPCTT